MRWRAPRRSGSVRCLITMCSSVPSKQPPRVCTARPRQSLGADHESGAGQWRLPAAGRGTPQTAPRRCPVSLPPLRGWVIPQPGSSGSVSSSSVSPCRRAHHARSPSRPRGLRRQRAPGRHRRRRRGQGSPQPLKSRNRPPTVKMTIAARSGYCALTASWRAKRASERSWATTAAAMWPTTMALAWTHDMAVGLNRLKIKRRGRRCRTGPNRSRRGR